MVADLNLSWQGIKRKAVYIKEAGKCMGQCTLEGSVQGGGIDTGGKVFLIDFKIDQSEMTKSHMFSMSLRLTNHK